MTLISFCGSFSNHQPQTISFELLLLVRAPAGKAAAPTTEFVSSSSGGLVRSKQVRSDSSPRSSVSSLSLEQQAEAKAIKEAGMEQNCSSMDTSGQLKRVAACVGGKCKKMGAHVLMEEFQSVLGAGGSVVGCKCKTAPNVRICSTGVGEEGGEDDSVWSPCSNPLLCLGVGLDDVGFIMANYFGYEQTHVGVSLDSVVSPSASYL